MIDLHSYIKSDYRKKKKKNYVAPLTKSWERLTSFSIFCFSVLYLSTTITSQPLISNLYKDFSHHL